MSLRLTGQGWVWQFAEQQQQEERCHARQGHCRVSVTTLVCLEAATVHQASSGLCKHLVEVLYCWRAAAVGRPPREGRRRICRNRDRRRQGGHLDAHNLVRVVAEFQGHRDRPVEDTCHLQDTVLDDLDPEGALETACLGFVSEVVDALDRQSAWCRLEGYREQVPVVGRVAKGVAAAAIAGRDLVACSSRVLERPSQPREEVDRRQGGRDR